jgi:serine/threonine protein kinase
VSDFGLTGIKSGMGNDEVFKTCQGTILYMSPERIADQPHSFSADIWSLGVICIELTQGKVPFEKTNYFEVMDEVNNLSKMELSSSLYSTEFQQFIRGCLEIQPEKRLSASALLNTDFMKKYAAIPMSALEEFIAKFTK